MLSVVVEAEHKMGGPVCPDDSQTIARHPINTTLTLYSMFWIRRSNSTQRVCFQETTKLVAARFASECDLLPYEFKPYCAGAHFYRINWVQGFYIGIVHYEGFRFWNVLNRSVRCDYHSPKP